MKNDRKKNNQDPNIQIIDYPKTIEYPVNNSDKETRSKK